MTKSCDPVYCQPEPLQWGSRVETAEIFNLTRELPGAGRGVVLAAPPAPPAVERKDIQQWTVRLSKALIDHLKAVAYERRIPPSQLLENWLWQQAHHDRSPSTP